jgi:hypothetical protein
MNLHIEAVVTPSHNPKEGGGPMATTLDTPRMDLNGNYHAVCSGWDYPRHEYWIAADNAADAKRIARQAYGKTYGVDDDEVFVDVTTR